LTGLISIVIEDMKRSEVQGKRHSAWQRFLHAEQGEARAGLVAAVAGGLGLAAISLGNGTAFDKVAPLVALVVMALASLYAAENLRNRSKVRPVSLEARLQNVGTSMRESVNVVRQIELELSVRERHVQELAQQANNAKAAAALSQPERDAVATMVREEMLAQNRKYGRQQLLVNLLFFVAGIAASVVVQLLVRPLV
jgi:hypothetical protein